MGIFDRFRKVGAEMDGQLQNVAGDPTQHAPPAMDPETAEEITERVLEWYSPGFHAESEVRPYAGDLGLDYPDVTSRQMDVLVDGVLEDMRATHARWSDEGDYPAVAAAFADLEADGILARMNFTCCNTCGHDEIRDEEGAAGARGYVFFHEQDSARLGPDGSDLYLGFGSLQTPDPETAAAARAGDEAARARLDAGDVEIGRAAEAALTARGLSVTWNGTIHQRLAVTGLDWRKLPPR